MTDTTQFMDETVELDLDATGGVAKNSEKSAEYLEECLNRLNDDRLWKRRVSVRIVVTDLGPAHEVAAP